MPVYTRAWAGTSDLSIPNSFLSLSLLFPPIPLSSLFLPPCFSIHPKPRFYKRHDSTMTGAQWGHTENSRFFPFPLSLSLSLSKSRVIMRWFGSLYTGGNIYLCTWACIYVSNVTGFCPSSPGTWRASFSIRPHSTNETRAHNSRSTDFPSLAWDIYIYFFHYFQRIVATSAWTIRTLKKPVARVAEEELEVEWRLYPIGRLSNSTSCHLITMSLPVLVRISLNTSVTR